MDDQLNPASPSFHKWLTPQQVGSLYGPSQAEVDAVCAWLVSQELSVTEVSADMTRITFAGNSSAVGRALNTEFHLYKVRAKDGVEQRLAVDREPEVPVALAPVIRAFGGMATETLGTDIQSQNVAFTGTSHSLTAQNFVTAYDIGPVYKAGYTGAGVKVAVVGTSDVIPGDITSYQTLMGLNASAQPFTIVPPGTTDPGNTGPGEQTLDVNRVMGTAPGAETDLLVSTGSATATGLYVDASYEVNSLVDPIMTISYGGCESQTGQAQVQMWTTLFQTAASEGITTLVSANDSGSECGNHGANNDPGTSSPVPTNPVVGINYLCSNIYVTCMGGATYNDNPVVVLTGGQGTGATATANVTNGVITSVTVNAGGSGYVSGDTTVVFYDSANGYGATGKVTVTGGAVTAISVTYGGGSYTTATASVTIVPGAVASGTPTVTNGVITAITLGRAGSGYSSAPAITINGGGTGAAATAAVVSGKVTGFTVSAGGSGYVGFSSYWNDAAPLSPTLMVSTLTALPPEGVWNNALDAVGYAGVAGGTGGYSLYTPRPSWQTGTGIATTGYAATQRLVPDLVLLASPYDGYFQCLNGSCSASTPTYISDGGTSAAAPGMAGIMALVVQKYGYQGNFNPVLYYLANNGSSNVFHDVTVASSGVLTCTATVSSICNNSEPYLTYNSGAGATATANVVNGTVSTIAVNAGGSAYVQPPAVIIVGNGTGASATAYTTNGVVTSIAVTSAGTGYTAAPTIVLAPDTLGYAVGTGFDMATGWGSLDVNKLMNANINYNSNSYEQPVTAYPTQTSIAYGTSLVNNLNATTTYNGASLLQLGTTTYSATVAGGAAVPVTTSTVLASGTYTLTAIWQPNANSSSSQYYFPSSASTTLVVLSPSVTLTPPASTVTIATQGGTYVGGVMATSVGYAGSVTLTCSVVYTGTGTASNLPGCSVTPASFTLATNGTGTAVMYLTTTAQVAQLKQVPVGLMLGGGALACLALFVPFRRRRLPVLLLLVAMLAGAAGLSGCAKAASTPPPSGGTTLGNYTVTVNGTYAGATASSTSFTLTVN